MLLLTILSLHYVVHVHVRTYVCASMQACQTVSLAFCPLCLSLQACEDGGGPNVFGIASLDSATMGDVTKSGWTFTISYTNTQQNKASHVTFKLATIGGTQFNFTSEDPPNTYVSCCSFFNVHLCMYGLCELSPFLFLACICIGQKHSLSSKHFIWTIILYLLYMHYHCHRVLTNRHARA